MSSKEKPLHSFDDSNAVLIKDHISHEETFVEVFEYAFQKLRDPWYKTFLFGIMAGFFVAIAYVIVIVALSGFIIKDSNGNLKPNGMPSGVIALITGLTFTPAILMVIFIGGTLFTSNSLTLLPIVKREAKLRRMLVNLSLVLVGNCLGALIVAISTYLMGHMKVDSEFYNAFKYIYDKKIGSSPSNLNWTVFLKNFVSGIYCNILIAGLFWMNMSVKNSATKVLLCFFVILAFGISGFQHIVANAYVWMTGLFLNNGMVGQDFGTFSIMNMLPTLLGNFIGGSVVLPMVYLLVFKKRINAEIAAGKFKGNKL